MKFLPLFSTLFLGVLAAAADNDDGCMVPQVILHDLPKAFTLVLSATKPNPDIDGQTLTFQVLRKRGSYDVGLLSEGEHRNLNLSGGRLRLQSSPAVAYIVEPRGRPRFREIQFSSRQGKGAEYEAYYRCHNGSAQRVVRPVMDDGVFCVYLEKNGEYGLWIQPRGGSEDCIEVAAVVGDDIEPL